MVTDGSDKRESLRAPIELKGTVMWTNKPTEVQNPEIGSMGMGIRFIFENDSERTDFESQVEALMVDSLGPHLYKKLLEKTR